MNRLRISKYKNPTRYHSQVDYSISWRWGKKLWENYRITWTIGDELDFYIYKLTLVLTKDWITEVCFYKNISKVLKEDYDWYFLGFALHIDTQEIWNPE